jgi:hypothetical protein
LGRVSPDSVEWRASDAARPQRERFSRTGVRYRPPAAATAGGLLFVSGRALPGGHIETESQFQKRSLCATDSVVKEKLWK